jgi:thiamine-monophosphate kinase
MATSPRPSEFDLIERYFAPISSPGAFGLRDDAARLRPTTGCDFVLTKDMLVAGVHFFPDDPPASIARKALRVNLSDLAAKGAVPTGFLLGLGLPRDWTAAWLEGFADALGDDARMFGCPLFGGDTVTSPGGLTISITAFGLVPAGHMVRRTTATAGDHIYVSGSIGDAALGLKLRLDPAAPWQSALKPAQRSHLLDRYLHPQPRLSLASVVLNGATAAMDISDGLVGDLMKLAGEASLAPSVEIGDVPLSPAAQAATTAFPELMEAVLTGGDDYEICAAVSPNMAAAFEAEAAAVGVPVTCIGRLQHPSAATGWRLPDGQAMTFSQPSFTHF